MGRRKKRSFNKKIYNTWRDTNRISNRRLPRSLINPASLSFGYPDLTDEEVFREHGITKEQIDWEDFENQQRRNQKRNARNRHLRLVEDRREHHPSYEDRPARSFNQANHRLIAWGLGSSVPAAIGFHRPSKVLTCVRRKIRREVMFAFNKTGRRGQKRPKFNWRSFIKCGR